MFIDEDYKEGWDERNERFISFETAKLAYEKGFKYLFFKEQYIELPEDATSYLNKRRWPTEKVQGEVINYFKPYFIYNAPKQSLLQKWLREVHGIFVLVNYYGKNEFWIEILNSKGNDIYHKSQDFDFNTYEDALEIGLQEGLKLI